MITSNLPLLQKVDDVPNVEVCVSLDAPAIAVTAHHHDLGLVEALSRDHTDPRVTKLMEANILVQPNGSPSPSNGCGDAMRGVGEQSAVERRAGLLSFPKQFYGTAREGHNSIPGLAVDH